MEVVAGAESLLTVTEHGFGKRTLIEEYPLRNRGGKGVITIQTTERNGMVVGARLVGDQDEVMLISDKGKIIRTKAGGISVIGRNTQGVKLIGLAPGERLVAMAKLAEGEINDESGKETEDGPSGVDENGGS
jgi:DNA gyrase subunit A